MWTETVSYVFFPQCKPTRQSLRQLSDVAEGLKYLHSCDIVHGDLKGASDSSISLHESTAFLTSSQRNILVDAAGRARITDAGLAMVTQDLESIRSTLVADDHSTRWVAPEILQNKGIHSKEADIFSFAGVAIEVRFRYPIQGQ